MEEKVFLSHSSATLYQKCPRAWYYKYVLRLEPDKLSANLVFGKAVDEAFTAYAVAHAFGAGEKIDMESIFTSSFDEQREKSIVDYSSIWSGPDRMIAAGKDLLVKLKAKWSDLGYTLALDKEGKPLAQLEMKVNIPGNIVFTSILDYIVMDPAARLILLDLKTPSQPSPEAFGPLSMQLTGYQLAVQTHRERLGVDHLDGVGFLEALKRPVPKTTRGKGPQVLDPHIIPPRKDEEMGEFIQTLQWVAEDIRAKRFPKRPLDAYNSPCAMCEFANLCNTGSMEGLRKRPVRSKRGQPVTI